MLNFFTVGAITSFAASFAIYNAYNIKRQFFPTCVYLMKSAWSVMALVSFVLYMMVLGAYLLTRLLFGKLRLIESEHIREYGWLTVSESFLAMTIFRDEFDSRFILLFTMVLITKCFHWVGRDRVDYMEQTARLPQYFHARMISTILILTVVDILGFGLCIYSVIKHGPSMSILFGAEFALLIVSLMSIAVRYTLNFTDIQKGTPWEHRSIFLFYYDFVVDLLKLIIYSTFFGIIVMYYGVPLHIIRDLYLTVRSFISRVKDIINYRRATNNMNERYPNATEAELNATDRICIICREEMTSAKKLDCGHCFHFRCLRSWMERQQACPTCRRPLLEERPAQSTTPQQQNPPFIWRNGRWEPMDPANIPRVNQQAVVPGVPINPDLRERPDVPANNAGPVVVFPNLPAAATPMPHIPGRIVPGPTSNVPVILIEPDQVAVIPPPPNPNRNFDQNNRAPLTPQPTVEGDHQVPGRPRTTSPSNTTQQNSSYVLKTADGTAGNGPIYLEPVTPFLSYPSPNIRIATPLVSNNQPLTLSSSDSKLMETNELRAKFKGLLREELDNLSRLQGEISVLTERILITQDRLDSLDSEYQNLKNNPNDNNHQGEKDGKGKEKI